MGHSQRATGLEDQGDDFIQSKSSRRVLKSGLWMKKWIRNRGGRCEVVSMITPLRQSCGIWMSQEICSGEETKMGQEMDTPVLLKVAISITGGRLRAVKRCCLRPLRACKSITGDLMNRLAQALHLRHCSWKRKYEVLLSAARFLLPILTPLIVYLSALVRHLTW
jgi:hypothetical protein